VIDGRHGESRAVRQNKDAASKATSAEVSISTALPLPAGQVKALDDPCRINKLPKPVVVVLDAPDDMIRKRSMRADVSTADRGGRRSQRA
jgi:hypothetical protein